MSPSSLLISVHRHLHRRTSPVVIRQSALGPSICLYVQLVLSPISLTISLFDRLSDRLFFSMRRWSLSDGCPTIVGYPTSYPNCLYKHRLSAAGFVIICSLSQTSVVTICVARQPALLLVAVHWPQSRFSGQISLSFLHSLAIS